MDQYRSARPPGSLLELGGTVYRLEAVEGCGSSAVVYRATYRDQLNRDATHQVFLKELCPVCPQGGVRRGADGSVICEGPGRSVMEEARRRFRMGNQVNLELLGLDPAATAGNLNSYEAYGTYYSVLAVHGGENLLRRLESGPPLSVREAVVIFRQLLLALAVFHRRGLLHLDISPDNILLLPERVLLIDFNSVWDTANPDWAAFAFSRKAGYSPPEVLLQNRAEIGPATDLYACCAVLFHMLAGRRLREAELGDGLRRALPAALPCLKTVPQTAASKAAELLLRGLHPLARKRFQSTAALLEQADELLRRLDGFGVTHSALWEASAAQWRRLRQPAWAYLEQPVAAAGETFCREALAERLSGGARFLLTGPGGMGKTRLLLELWRRCAAIYRPDAPVFFYIALKDYQEAGPDNCFLRRALLRGLRFSPDSPHWADALHALEGLLDRAAAGRASVVLLLDGLNEAGPRRENLLREIEALGARPGVGVLVTERTAAVLDYGLAGFVPLTLSPLRQAQVETQLAGQGIAVPPEEKLRQLLTTPMLLFLYLECAQMPAGAAPAAVPETQEALLSLYLDRFCRQALRTDSGSQKSQLITKYLLDHLLPEIAWELKRRDKTVLPVEAVRQLVERSHRALRSRAFGAAFPAYLGKSRLMLEGVGSADEWYDLAVREQLTDRFGLLTETGQGQISLLHDAFLPVLARQAQENRRRLAGKTTAVWRRRGAAALLAVLLLGGAAAATAGYVRSRAAYTAQEQAQIAEALTVLSAALGTWSNCVTAQQELLERASISDVLDNQDDQAREALAQLIEQKTQFLASLYTPPLDSALLADLEAVAADKALFSPGQWDALLTHCAAMAPAAQTALPQLEEALCAPESIYHSRDQRERLLMAYAAYLEAEIRYVSYLLAALLQELPQAQQAEILAAMTYMQALDGFYDGPGSVATERLADGTDRAWETLKEARRALTAQGFAIAWEAE